MGFSIAAAPEIDYFVGRASNLDSIKAKLLPSHKGIERKVLVLYGLGGIGKSQIAIEFAKKHRHDYTAVLWLNAKTEDSLKQSFVVNAQRLPRKFLPELLQGPQNKETLDSIVYEVKKWLSLPGNNRWLLIYDDVREEAYDIKSYFPEVHQGSILVTTRTNTLEIGQSIEVKKLSENDESVSLLERKSGRALKEG